MAAIQEPLVCAPQESTFLSHPGEIRNYIYSFCVEPVNAVPGFGKMKFSDTSTPRDVYSKFDYGWSSDCWNTVHGVYLQPSATQVDYYFAGQSKKPHLYSRKREFFALTQVCRQVQLEYAPVYRRALHVNIWLPDLRAFIDTFYPLGQPKEIMQNYEGKITIQVPCIEEAWMDLTPLLKLSRCAPLVQVDFDSPFLKPSIIKDINHLFSPGSPQPHVKRSGSWFCLGMERVRYPGLHSVYIRLRNSWNLYNRGGNPEIKVIFKKEGQRQWMSTPSLRYYQFGSDYDWPADVLAPVQHVQEALAIAKKLGLSDCKSSWFVAFGVNKVID